MQARNYSTPVFESERDYARSAMEKRIKYYTENFSRLRFKYVVVSNENRKSRVSC